MAGWPSTEPCALLSRSTKGLRNLLAESEIEFSLPLCTTRTNQVFSQEMKELKEMEEAIPGKSLMMDAVDAVDSNEESLVCIRGRPQIHGFYDFLLNSRNLLSPAIGSDLPLLLSPVAFRNACAHMPEVKCRTLRENLPPPSAIPKEVSMSLPSIFGTTKQPKKARSGVSGGSIDGDYSEPTEGVRHSVEVTGLLPPWVLSRLCHVFRQAQNNAFEVRLYTEQLTTGLNHCPNFDGVSRMGDADGSSRPSFNILSTTDSEQERRGEKESATFSGLKLGGDFDDGVRESQESVFGGGREGTARDGRASEGGWLRAEGTKLGADESAREEKARQNHGEGGSAWRHVVGSFGKELEQRESVARFGRVSDSRFGVPKGSSGLEGDSLVGNQVGFLSQFSQESSQSRRPRQTSGFGGALDEEEEGQWRIENRLGKRVVRQLRCVNGVFTCWRE
eukprot:TRINITY_DN2464_c0_g5_i1.p1 TRINITY_DN2464_c0_g5~~TRINITY_DN2464_c0_g5_i1.p1  ORF type:complete len:476 (+),score=68.29 TRINITY_DN2464_c0_g5_i1:85-1428(+)